MATVIKAERFAQSFGQARPFSLKNIEREAAEILERARTEAEQIVQQARTQAKKIRNQAHDEGLIEGRTQGEPRGREEGYRVAKEEAQQNFTQQHEQLVETLTTALETFEAERREYLSRTESDLMELVLAIARRVVKRIGVIDRQAAIENLREATRYVAKQSDVTIKVHPKDIQVIEVFAQSLAAAEKTWRHVGIVADETISPGGCIVLCGRGEVDATLETQLEHIATSLVGGEMESV